VTYRVPFMLLTDGYKVDHRRQYPPKTSFVMTNMTARKGRAADDTGIIAVGFQGAIQEIVEYAHDTFFARPVDEVAAEYEQAMLEYLGPNAIGVNHIRELHAVGYLPLNFDAVAEGTFVPYGVPILTVLNTDPRFFWLTNYVETLLSASLWQIITSATTAFKYRVLLEHYAEATGTAQEFVGWQAHDFSFRGMSSVQSALYSGAGHLMSFTGTDTIPAIHYLKHYYDAEGLIGGSVAATEHSVMCAGGKDDERETYERLLDLYPNGILSVVSDTWDLWKVITEILPSLKDKILARDGKLVIRPDSGDPVKIICGDPEAPDYSPARKGVVALLWDLFGGTRTETGHRVLDSHIGVIYGDSITLDRCNAICAELARQGFASANMVFGVGSYTYQYNTRDTHGFALKATYAVVDGEESLLFKDPVTDDGTKRSARGLLLVHRDNGVLALKDGYDLTGYVAAAITYGNLLKPVWGSGVWNRRETLAGIRERIRGEVADQRKRKLFL
jgi:nicotinamide phosphoribosyltransferase